jgi:hypothetical protein
MTVLSATMSWYSDGSRRGKLEQPRGLAIVPDASSGEFAYVLGMWPQFYVYNGLIPASGVQFPWALSGTPASFYFSLPKTDSHLGRTFSQVRERNAHKLFNDFAITPPSYVVISHGMARRPDSARVADVPGLDEYLLSHCVAAGRVADNKGAAQSLFRCNSARDRQPNPEPAVSPARPDTVR